MGQIYLGVPSQTFSGAIPSTCTADFVKVKDNTLILSGNNNYSTKTKIIQGVLQFTKKNSNKYYNIIYDYITVIY